MLQPAYFADPLAEMREVLKSSTFGDELEVITPAVELLSPVDTDQIMRFLESAIRTAYKSEDKIGPGSAEKIVNHILSLKHESTLEHSALSFRCTTSRGVTHELVRHRIASYTQESTRYVNYGKRPPQIILPWHICGRQLDEKLYWYEGQHQAIKYYHGGLDRGWKAQDARGFLTNDLKTEIVTTMNLRSLRHFFTLRCAPSAHPDMQVLAREMFKIVYGLLPLIFADIHEDITSRIGAAA